MMTSLLLGLPVLLFYWMYLRSMARRKLPPGPLCLPLVGTILSTDLTDFVGSCARWAKCYGRIVTSQLGPHTAVVLNDPALIREAFAKEIFIPRPQFWSLEQRKSLNNNTNGELAH